jgi:hypothetical protein
MVVAEPETNRDSLGEGAGAVTLPYRLSDRVERLEAVGTAAGVNADAFGRAMIDRDEHRRLALAGHHRGQVGRPHDIDLLSDDGAVVGLRAARSAHPLMCQEAMCPHQSQDPAAAGADAGKAQPRP